MNSRIEITRVLHSTFRMLVEALLATLIASSSAAVFPMRPRLIYFDARGAAEICRILLKIGKVDFEDVRFPIKFKANGTLEADEYNEAKARGDFVSNLNRVPILEIDSLQIGQSKAIERYIAKKCDLMGSNDEECAVIDCIAEHVRDIKDRFVKVISEAGKMRSPERNAAMKKWLSDGEYAQWLSRLEASLPLHPHHSKDYVIGNRLSYADVSIWHLISEFYEDKDLSKATSKQFKRVSRIAQVVADHPEVKRWLAERPQTKF